MGSYMAIDSTYNQVVFDPKFLQSFNSKIIKIVAPASGTSEETLMQLKKIPGLQVEIPDNLIANEVIYHANSDDARFLQLKAALYDERAGLVIWTLRGGYGSARLIDQLAALEPPRHEKIFIGFSDNTALHLFLSQQWGWRTIHASGFSQLIDFNQNSQNYIRLAELISGCVKEQIIEQLAPLNASAIQATRITGTMQGGNLTLVESSIGTSWQMNTSDTILFLEEVGEKGYRIDRSLNHLRQAGLLRHVNAIVFGECLGPDTDGITVALQRFAYETLIPVFQTHQFGHGNMNYPIVYQSSAEISLMKRDFALRMQVQ